MAERVVAEEVAVPAWTMVVDATTSPTTAARLPARTPAPAVSAHAVPETAEDVAATLLAAVGDTPPPAAVVMIVAADTDRHRFAVLTDAAGVAGLPAPTWVPDAVARAGTVLAALQADRPRLVVDTRNGDLAFWGVRPARAGGRVGPVEPVDVDDRVEDLLVAVLRAKLAVMTPDAPALLASLDEHGDPEAQRTAARVRRELRRAGRSLGTDASGDARIVVATGDVEVVIDARELAGVVAHAARESLVEVLGADAGSAVAVVVAGGEGGFARTLASALGGMTVVPEHAGSALDGAAALARAHRDQVEAAHAEPVRVPTPRRGPPVENDPPAPRPAPSAATRHRPAWLVPTLSSLVATVMLAAGGVLLTGAVAPAEPLPAPASSPTSASATAHPGSG